jgi:predicted component of type VI protein secretion system
MPLNARLVVVGGEVKTAEIKLRLPSTIGRGRGATIMLPHPLVSRQHCELFESDGRLMVRDLGSLNGTFINNERISEATLPSGDLLTVGAVTFRAMYESSASAGPPSDAGPASRSKSRDTDSNGTLRSADPRPASSKVSPSDDEPVEVDFNFDEPLTPVDEGAHVATPTLRDSKNSVQVEATVEALSKSDLVKTKPAAGKPAPAAEKPVVTAPVKPIPPVQQAATASAVEKDNQTVNFGAWDLDEKPDPKGESDDDFGDFLKSLETK